MTEVRYIFNLCYVSLLNIYDLYVDSLSLLLFLKQSVFQLCSELFLFFSCNVLILIVIGIIYIVLWTEVHFNVIKKWHLFLSD